MTLLRLALADLWHDRIVALCNVAAIVGVVAPLAILAGIKAGVVEALIADLKARPDVLRVAIVGDHGFSEADVAGVRGWAETGFVTPSSRAIARRLLVRRASGGTVIRRAGLVATAPGSRSCPRDRPSREARWRRATASRGASGSSPETPSRPSPAGAGPAARCSTSNSRSPRSCRPPQCRERRC